MKSIVKYCGVLLVFAMGSATFVALPALAEDEARTADEESAYQDLMRSILSNSSLNGSSDSVDDSDSVNDQGKTGLTQGGPVGPVGAVGLPTFQAVLPPGETIPKQLDVLVDDTNVDLLTVSPDRDLFMALLIINDKDAAVKYRFENAVPQGHSTVMQEDGSLRFFDGSGREVGGIAAPWALDAKGEKVDTHYTLDGDTLVQTVDHREAAYPVVADPVWFAPIKLAIFRCLADYACREGVRMAVRQAIRVADSVQKSSRNRPPSSSNGSCKSGLRIAFTCVGK